MIPDFNKKTIETVAQRAAYRCSNPDCRVNTIGPNSEPDKSIVIGEAAHIYGARPDSKRYNHYMNDASRAEITNSIWLCRNFHKLIDTDERKYTSDILFAWREKHEAFVLSQLGSPSDILFHQEQQEKLKIFDNYPRIVKRIIIDKPEGWEWRLTAELMRYLNNPLFRKLEDLSDGLYIKNQNFIENDRFINWIQIRIAEVSNLLRPAVGLLDRLNKSWGPPGQPGNIEEIHHITCLIRDYIEQVISFEEKIYFVNAPKECKGLIQLLKDMIGSQVRKLSIIPDSLDEIVLMLGEKRNDKTDEPILIKKVITFDLPIDWEIQFNRELKKFERSQKINKSSGCLTFAILLFGTGILLFLFPLLI